MFKSGIPEAPPAPPQATAVPITRSTSGLFATFWTVQGWGLILLTFMSFFPRLFHIEEYLFFTLLATAIAAAWANGRTIWVRTPIDLPLLLFVGWVLLTIPFAIDPSYSFAEWRKLVAQVLVFYWTLLVLREQPKDEIARGILIAVVVGTAVLAAYSLTDFVESGGTWRDRFVRAQAPASDYQWLSTYMVIAIPMLIASSIVFRNWWQRAACLGAVGLALLAQVFSYTRAGWLGMATQALAFGLFIGRRRLSLWLVASCLMIGVGLLSVSQMGYQRSTVDPWTLNARLVVWKAGIAEMLKHPLVGFGYGNYSFSVLVHGTPTGDMVMGLHNTFLMVGVGSGLPALAALVWTLVTIAKAVFEKFNTTESQWERLVSLALVLIVVGFSVRNLFDYMFAGSLAYLFWMLMATGLTEGADKKVIDVPPSGRHN